MTVMMAAEVRPGCVLAATYVTGELDGNFSTMITSCCICSVNISGVCRRRYYFRGWTTRQRRGENGNQRAKKLKVKAPGRCNKQIKVREKGGKENTQKHRKLEA